MTDEEPQIFIYLWNRHAYAYTKGMKCDMVGCSEVATRIRKPSHDHILYYNEGDIHKEHGRPYAWCDKHPEPHLKLNFIRFEDLHDSPGNSQVLFNKDRLKAGINGAKYALSELENDLKSFPEETCRSKMRLIDEIKNLKIFLGVKND